MTSLMILLPLLVLTIRSAASAVPVKVEFYGEALCPYCQWFVNKVAGPLIDAGIDDLFTFKYVPYGNARVVNGSVSCQHGPLECSLNTLFSCAIHLHPKLSDWYPYVRCVEAYKPVDMPGAVRTCADSSPGLDVEAVLSCSTGDLGRQLQEAARAATEALVPAHTYVPWVVVNGIPLEDTFDLLKKYVCVAAGGDRCTGQRAPLAGL